MRIAGLPVLCVLLLVKQVAGLSDDILHRVLLLEPNLHLQELGKVSDSDKSLERTFWSPAHRQAAALIQRWMDEAGMRTWIDAVGNVHGRIDSRNKGAPVLLTGSHYDTVQDAGKFDGALGIIVPIAAVKAAILEAALENGNLDEEDIEEETGDVIRLNHLLRRKEASSLLDRPIEVIAFSEEEGVRFQTTFLGSRAIVGNLWGSGVLEAEDREGKSVLDVIGLTGPDAQDTISKIAMRAENVSGYVEVHMEQGPVLETEGLPLAVVAGIAGQTRQLVKLSGTQGHAGTIPMPMRKDSMAAAAELVHWVERRCGGGAHSTEGDKHVAPEDHLVCTTGSISLWPGTFNVVPGSANFSLDIRSRNDEVWREVAADAAAEVARVCERRGLSCSVEQKTAANAVHSDMGLLDRVRSAIYASQPVAERLVPDIIDVEPDYGSCSTIPDGSEDAQIEGTCTTEGVPADVLPELEIGWDPPTIVSGAGHDAMAIAEITPMAMMFVRCKGGHSHSPLEHVAEADVAAATAALYKFFEQELLDHRPALV